MRDLPMTSLLSLVSTCLRGNSTSLLLVYHSLFYWLVELYKKQILIDTNCKVYGKGVKWVDVNSIGK